jgi:hypothetical protein
MVNGAGQPFKMHMPHALIVALNCADSSAISSKHFQLSA